MDDPGPRWLTLSILSAYQGGVSGSKIVLDLFILFVLILINAFFAMSEIAVISLNDSKIEKAAEEGNKKAKQILKLTKDSSRFLSTIQVGVTLAGFLDSAVASQSFSPMLSSALTNWLTFLPVNVANAVSTVLITLVLSYFSLVLGELVPKKLALARPERISYLAVRPLLFVSAVTRPFTKLLSASTNGLVRLFGIDPEAETEHITEEEIRLLVDVGEEKGVIEDTQAEMINNIFEIDNLDAGDVMTHRVDMTAVEADEPISVVIKASIEEGYSRIPVYDDDPDNIVGIVYIKDLLKFIGEDIPESATIRTVMREAYFVPETKKCAELLKEMTEKHLQMAVVVDEYGGTAGIVTFEDLVETIVGNIQDEYDDEDEEINKINDNVYTIDGATDIDEVSEIIGRDLPEGDYDSIGGFIISRLGYLPEDGNLDTVELDNLRFTVLSVEGRRIEKVKIEILPTDNTDKEESE
ncbi:MAG: HlyC/CorC family transporter [Clostridia bacterium]|nr:HlyC/CorC family transporter [Clostridia bacterium]